MCGIAGCIGTPDAGKILIDALKRLEYRGYDSAGITLGGKKLYTVKTAGKVAALEEKLLSSGYKGTRGIAHTRWATHGIPSEANAHPHLTEDGTISVVHNGIIENHQQLRAELEKKGHVFRSETDSEVIPHLLEESGESDPLAAALYAFGRLKGSFASAVLFEKHPDQMICACHGSPLVLGLGDGMNMAASDMLALAPYVNRIVVLHDGEAARITANTAELFTIGDAKSIQLREEPVPGEARNAEKNGYEHFMLKEIMEQPEALEHAFAGRMNGDRGVPTFPEFGLSPRETARISRIVTAACGSSMHAGLTGQYYFEDIAGIAASVEQAAEFRYRNPILEPDTLVLAVSQSGETADTIAAVREAVSKGAYTVGVCNVPDSTIARESDCRIYLHAGPEQSVASTKAFTSQVTTLLLFSLFLGRNRRLSRDDGLALMREAERIPDLVREVLKKADEIRELAKKYAWAEDLFYIGRGCLYPAALEGALKIKEISYVHAEGCHSAELKHGPIALLDEKVPVIALANRIPGQEKMLGNIRECLARKAPVIAVVSGNDTCLDSFGVDLIRVPESSRFTAPLATVVALQLFAYYFACERGCAIDQPRNLAKSVTVE